MSSEPHNSDHNEHGVEKESKKSLDIEKLPGSKDIPQQRDSALDIKISHRHSESGDMDADGKGDDGDADNNNDHDSDDSSKDDEGYCLDVDKAHINNNKTNTSYNVSDRGLNQLQATALPDDNDIGKPSPPAPAPLHMKDDDHQQNNESVASHLSTKSKASEDQRNTYPDETNTSNNISQQNPDVHSQQKPLSKRKRLLIRNLGPLSTDLAERPRKPVSYRSKATYRLSATKSTGKRRGRDPQQKKRPVKRATSSWGDDGASDDDEDSDDDEEDEIYEVEAIRSHQVYRRNVIRYEVKWKGYPESENTKEPANQFHEDCREMCLQYWRSLPSDVIRPVNAPKEHQESARIVRPYDTPTSDPKRQRLLSPTANDLWNIPNRIYSPTSLISPSPLPHPSSFSRPEPESDLSTTNNQRTTAKDATNDGYVKNNLDDELDFWTDYSDEYQPENINDDVHYDSEDLGSVSSDDHKIDKGNRNNKTTPLRPDLDDTDIFNQHIQTAPISPRKLKAKYDRENPTTTTSRRTDDIITYIEVARQKSITQNTVAANYKNDGFELAYSKHLRATAKLLDWSDDFTIRNILPAKNDHSQLLAYLVWPNDLKTVHLIQELHDKCPKKLCLYYEERIRYS